MIFVILHKSEAKQTTCVNDFPKVYTNQCLNTMASTGYITYQSFLCTMNNLLLYYPYTGFSGGMKGKWLYTCF